MLHAKLLPCLLFLLFFTISTAAVDTIMIMIMVTRTAAETPPTDPSSALVLSGGESFDIETVPLSDVDVYVISLETSSF